MRHFDLHADTLSKCLKGRKSLVHNDYAISVERGLIFDQWVQAFAVFVPDELHAAPGTLLEHPENVILLLQRV